MKLVLAVALASCTAPQHGRPARITYATMATLDGAILGEYGGFLPCVTVFPKLTKGTSGCIITAAALGSSAALYGTLTTHDEAGPSSWVAVSAPIVALVVVVAYLALSDR
jgi:hypothetical protein